MTSIGSGSEGVGARTRGGGAVTAAAVALAALSGLAAAEPGARGAEQPASGFPTVPPAHRHARALLENATRYADPAHKMTDEASGYPFEGWNHDPKQGLFLRSFTQLTAIGLWMEFLADVVAGEADAPNLGRERALANLQRLVKSLRADQNNPKLAAKGLLVNFIDLATGTRIGPLASDVEEKDFLGAFGPEKGKAVWKALQAKGWVVPRGKSGEAAIERVAGFGSESFNGVLAPFADAATKQKIMAILDRRVVLVVFGDNANLSASAAKTIGALLASGDAGGPGAAEVRRELERFLDDQREGYAHLYDAKAGLFDFGWDATRDRLFGWEDLQGNWTTGHMDYLVNEFRGPTTFVALRFGLPVDAIANLGFKMKPYRMRDGTDRYVLAPWEGSAFQALGLGLSMGELQSPSWRRALAEVVAVEVDYSTGHKLPGFLSESYTGEGVKYTGSVGIPEITVSPRPRITDAASLYTLGTAYTVAPERVEAFLAANWPTVSTLLTDHGPWEGYNTTRQEVIPFQTTAHTLSLALGLLGTGSDHMKRYLESVGAAGRLAETYRVGDEVDFLSESTKIFAWTGKPGVVRSDRDGPAFRVTSGSAGEVGIAFVPDRPGNVNLSGLVLRLRYRSSGEGGEAAIELKPGGDALPPGLIPKEVAFRVADTGGRDADLEVPLPATPGLARVKEVVITLGRGSKPRAVDFRVTGLAASKP